MLSLKNLTVRIGGVEILRRASIDLGENSFVALIGRNGAGKTTLMRATMGLVPVDDGTIRVDGQDLTDTPAHMRARLGIGYMPEDRRLVPDWTVEENLQLPIWAGRAAVAADRLGWIYHLIPEVAEFRRRRAMSLSGGQQKLVALARALMVSDKVLLLDEPFEGVAPALAERLVDVLLQLRREGRWTVLITNSDSFRSQALIDQVWLIERGRIEMPATAAEAD